MTQNNKEKVETLDLDYLSLLDSCVGKCASEKKKERRDKKVIIIRTWEKKKKNLLPPACSEVWQHF